MTAQVLDAIGYLGHYYELTGEPLETLFEGKRIRSPFVIDDAQYPKKLQRPDFSSDISSSTCHRGYIGEWVVADERLYLKELHGLGGEALRGLVFQDSADLWILNTQWARIIVIWRSGVTG